MEQSARKQKTLGNGCVSKGQCCFDSLLLVPIVIVIVVVVVMMMLVGVYSKELALALIMPMNPVMMFRPMPGNPYPFITIVPISRTLGVVRPIANADRKIDRHDA